MGRREDLVDAALRVLAEGGLKRLTHRAVDAEAGLPDGSAANVFRTRDSLVRAIMEEMERRDWSQFQAHLGAEAIPKRLTVDEAAGVLAATAMRMLAHEQVAVTRARLTLALAYPEEVREGHRRLVAALVRVLEAAGVSSPTVRAAHVAALLDGTLLHTLSVAEEPLDRAGLVAAIRALLVVES